MHQALGSSIHYFYPFKQFNSFWFRFGIEVEMATLSLHQTRLKPQGNFHFSEVTSSSQHSYLLNDREDKN